MSVLNAIRDALKWLTGSSLRAFVFIFILAAGYRVYSIRQIPVINLLPNQDRELGAIAMSLAETGRFADPYIIPIGQTAHLPPVPPAILALVYSWFGRTNTTAYLFIGFLIVTSSLTVALLP